MMLSSSLKLKRKSKISAKQFAIILALVIVSIAPLAFKKQGTVRPQDADRRITIITPHNETIRREFAEAFSEWWAKNNKGEQIYVNWITPGGGSEVRKVIDTKFSAFDKNKGSGGIDNVGLDVFFGGGDYEFDRAAKKGYLADLDIFTDRKMKQLFWEINSGQNDAIIPKRLNGEQYYHDDPKSPKGRKWVGVCLSRFGICYNTDVLNRLGLKPPTKWDDLADRRYIKNIALADPTKSGSVTRAFEMILQQKMQEYIAAHPNPQPTETTAQYEKRIKSEAWLEGLKLIQKITANARYFSDASSKIPHDVASGNAAAGMCIDFYGRTYTEKLMKEDGSSRIQFIIPEGGTSVSVDTVAVFRDAPEPELAQAFVKFCLTPQGQMLWNGKPGSPDGPKHTALRRMPIRRDMYSKKLEQHVSDPDDKPYAVKNGLVYKKELTAKTFKAIQVIIRVMAIDTHEELVNAWKVMIDHDFPREVMETHFHNLSRVTYTNALGDINENLRSKDKMHLETLQQELAKEFRRNYKKAILNATE